MRNYANGSGGRISIIIGTRGIRQGHFHKQFKARRLGDLIGQSPFCRFDFMAGGFTPLSRELEKLKLIIVS
jgi:hypothetical protein